MEDNGEPMLVEAKWLQEMAIRLEREEKRRAQTVEKLAADIDRGPD